MAAKSYVGSCVVPQTDSSGSAQGEEEISKTPEARGIDPFNAGSVDMLELVDLTDNISVASGGEASGATSESHHITTNLLKLEGKGFIGCIERMPMCLKILFLVLLSIAGMIIISATAIALSAKELDTSLQVNVFISQVNTFSAATKALIAERRAGGLMLLYTNDYTKQLDYMQAISATDLSIASMLSIMNADPLYSNILETLTASLNQRAQVRAKATARLLQGGTSALNEYYATLIDNTITGIHIASGAFGYQMGSTSISLYHEYMEACNKLAITGDQIILNSAYDRSVIITMAETSGEKEVTQRTLVNAIASTASQPFNQLVINTPNRLLFDNMTSEILTTTSRTNVSFLIDDWVQVSNDFLGLVQKEGSIFYFDVEAFASAQHTESTAWIAIVVCVVALFSVSSIISASFFAKTIVGPWQRLNTLQEMTIIRFVPKGFLHLMGWKKITDAKLGAFVEKDLTVMVVKIVGFSKIQTYLKTPEEPYNFINTFLSYVGPYIRNNHGYIDKYLSNQFIAIFEKDKRGIRAALEIQAAMSQFNKTQQSQIQLRISLVSGKTIIGTIGENERMESASLSKTTKTAFRLQRLSKSTGVASILVPRETLGRIPKQKSLHRRYIGHIKLGSTESTDVYELLTFADHSKIKTKDYFSRAVASLHASKFIECMSIMETISQANPNDSLAAKYKEIAKHCIVENNKRLVDLSITDILKDATMRLAFEQFCQQEHSIENLNLWNQIQLFKETQDSEGRLEIAKQIHIEFLGADSRQAVNLSEEQKGVVKHTLQAPEHQALSSLLFDGIEASIIQLMQDTLRRFKQTPPCKLAFLNCTMAYRVEELAL